MRQACAHSGMSEGHWQEARPAAVARVTMMESFMLSRYGTWEKCIRSILLTASVGYRGCA